MKNSLSSIKRPAACLLKAFTLIELLVVISIISILISILLPALAKSRESARTILCAINLKQCHLGFVNYMSDFKGTIPAYNTGGSSLCRWWNYKLTQNPCEGSKLNGYINAFLTSGYHRYANPITLYSQYRAEAGILACPSVVDPKPYVMDYGMNEFLKEWAGIHYDSIGSIGYLKMDDVLKASDAVLLGEPRNTLYLSTVNDPVAASAAIYRHNSKGNAVYVDGHASTSLDPGTDWLRMSVSLRP